MDIKLREAAISAKPKCVHIASKDGKIPTSKDLTVAEQEAVADLVECIKDGKIVPAWYYRNNQAQKVDTLLRDEGIMHLHLNKEHNDTVLYLIQYENDVLILYINGHYVMQADVQGKTLKQMLGKHIEKTESSIAERILGKRTALKKSLLPRKPLK